MFQLNPLGKYSDDFINNPIFWLEQNNKNLNVIMRDILNLINTLDFMLVLLKNRSNKSLDNLYFNFRNHLNMISVTDISNTKVVSILLFSFLIDAVLSIYTRERYEFTKKEKLLNTKYLFHINNLIKHHHEDKITPEKDIYFYKNIFTADSPNFKTRIIFNDSLMIADRGTEVFFDKNNKLLPNCDEVRIYKLILLSAEELCLFIYNDNIFQWNILQNINKIMTPYVMNNEFRGVDSNRNIFMFLINIIWQKKNNQKINIDILKNNDFFLYKYNKAGVRVIKSEHKYALFNAINKILMATV